MRISHLVSLAAVSAMLASGCATTHGTSPNGLEGPIEKAAIKFSTDIKEGGYKIVTTDELKKWLDEGKEITIISTLPAVGDKEFGSIAGALNAAMPMSEKDLTPEDREHLLRVAGNNKERSLVVYCGFVACRRSHIGAKLLIDNGFKNVYRYPAGLTGWEQAGYPLTK